MTPQAPVSADELLRLFDGELSDADTRAIQARLSASDRDTLAHWQTQKDQLRALGQAIAAETPPSELGQAMVRLRQAHAEGRRWWRWGGMAASMALAFGLGWTLGVTERPLPLAAAPHLPPSGQPGVQPVQTGFTFAAQAALAHATYTPEVKHPVEVSAEQQAHLVQWLSKRLGRPLQVPNLSAQGYELMGGRLLPGDAGARAQFMFQRTDGLRVTLYVGAVVPVGAAAHDTAFAFSKQGSVASFYWVDQGFGYALSAPLTQVELQSLAEAVYHQL